MPECDNCGAHVSTAWARVFAVDGEVRACLECGRRHGVEGEIIE